MGRDLFCREPAEAFVEVLGEAAEGHGFFAITGDPSDPARYPRRNDLAFSVCRTVFPFSDRGRRVASMT